MTETAVAGPYCADYSIPRSTSIGDVDVYRFNLESDEAICLSTALYFLSSWERERAAKFHRLRDRDTYIRARGLLRVLLGEYLNCAPQHVKIAVAGTGKPYVPGLPIYFNLSHSGAIAACAISWRHPVGIDVELIDRQMDFMKLAEHIYVGQELSVLHARVDKAQCFYEFWTAKEALMKLTGQGLRLTPREISLCFNGAKACGYAKPLPVSASLIALTIPQSMAACHLAVPRDRAQYRDSQV